jgi:hypothetical protein
LLEEKSRNERHESLYSPSPFSWRKWRKAIVLERRPWGEEKGAKKGA